MKFVTAADWHLSHAGPASRTDDWQEAIFAKLDQVAGAARKLKARAILMPGDVFHEKSRIPYVLICRLVAWCYALKKDGIIVVVDPGNHDEVNHRYESIPSQPLGVLFACGAMIDCAFRVIKFTDSKTLVPAKDYAPDAPGPHPGGEAFTVGVVGNPYPHATNLATYQDLPAHGCHRGVLLAHCFASPQGGSCFGEPSHSYAELAPLGFDAFVFGHDHSDHGVHVVEGKYFVNVGAISRGSLAKEEINRDVKIAVIDVTPEGVKVQQLKLKVSPAADVFDLQLKAQKDREHNEIEQFAEKLKSDLADAGPVSFKDRAARLDVPDTVRQRVLAYISEAESAS